jgi:hypothetical protein
MINAPNGSPNVSYYLHETIAKTVEQKLYENFVYTRGKVFVPFCRGDKCRSTEVENSELEYLVSLDVAYEVVRKSIILETQNHELASRVIQRMSHDTKLVNYGVACTAWLSFNNFKWNNILSKPLSSPLSLSEELKVEISCIPEDLNYGLVSTYPNSVIEFARFILGINRQEYLSLVTYKKIKLLKKIRQASLNS